MVVHPMGRHSGTVGGGCGEAAVMTAALDVIHKGGTSVISVDLTGEITADSAAVCGGLMDVFVERVASPTFGLVELQNAIESFDSNEPPALVTVIAAPPGQSRLAGDKNVVADTAELLDWIGAELSTPAIAKSTDEAFSSRRPLITAGWRADQLRPSADELVLFVEPLRKPPHLVIAGAGHIAVPLAQIGHTCGFRVTVLDDRIKFANAQRFPTANAVIASDMAETLRAMDLNLDCYVILVTRGHQHDVECLVEVVDKPLAYIGMIGSRRRVRGVFDMLQTEKGIVAEALESVHSPIGLDIGAKTPAEIAVAIMAEVINVYRGGRLD